MQKKTYNITYTMMGSNTINVAGFSDKQERDKWHKLLWKAKKGNKIFVFLGDLLDTKYVTTIYHIEDEFNEQVYSNRG